MVVKPIFYPLISTVCLDDAEQLQKNSKLGARFFAILYRVLEGSARIATTQDWDMLYLI